MTLLPTPVALGRYVSLLDALPLEPWKRAAPRPSKVLSTRDAKAQEEAHARRAEQRRRQQQQEEGGGSGEEDGEEGGGKRASRRAGKSELIDDEMEEAIRVHVSGALDPKPYSLSF